MDLSQAIDPVYKDNIYVKINEVQKSLLRHNVKNMFKASCLWLGTGWYDVIKGAAIDRSLWDIYFVRSPRIENKNALMIRFGQWDTTLHAMYILMNDLNIFALVHH